MTECLARHSDHFIQTDVGRLFARSWEPETPARSTIVLFHDSLGSVELWRDFPGRLSTEAAVRVVAYDRLGFGRSDPNPGILGPDFMIDEARVFLPHVREQLGIGQFIAMGHSVGGAMAVASGALNLDTCDGVITESAQAFVEDRTVDGILAAKRTFSDKTQVARLQRYHGEKTRWVLDAWINTWLAPDFADWSLDTTLAQLHCPVLAIHGGRDEYGSSAHPERIKSHAGAGAQVALLPDCGHVPHREYQSDVTALVAGFVRQLVDVR